MQSTREPKRAASQQKSRKVYSAAMIKKEAELAAAFSAHSGSSSTVRRTKAESGLYSTAYRNADSARVWITKQEKKTSAALPESSSAMSTRSTSRRIKSDAELSKTPFRDASSARSRRVKPEPPVTTEWRQSVTHTTGNTADTTVTASIPLDDSRIRRSGSLSELSVMDVECEPLRDTNTSQRAIRNAREALPSASTEVTYYVTNSGRKYHLSTCRHLRRSGHPHKTIPQGYEPCKVCIGRNDSKSTATRPPQRSRTVVRARKEVNQVERSSTTYSSPRYDEEGREKPVCFVTASGKKYHKGSCKCLNKSKIPQFSVPAGFAACRLCHK